MKKRSQTVIDAEKFLKDAHKPFTGVLAEECTLVFGFAGRELKMKIKASFVIKNGHVKKSFVEKI